jgi:putative membrane protein
VLSSLHNCLAVLSFGIANRDDSWSWSWEPALTIPLFALGVALLSGSVRLGERSRYSSQWRKQATCLALGWLSLVLAFNSPLHELGEHLFWMHMVQHEVLLLISAPLFALGNPFVTVLAALPVRLAADVGWFLRSSGLHATARSLCRPLPAWCLGAAALWIWHIPFLFDGTLRSDWIHAAQHLSFLATGFLFWVSLLESRARHADYGVSILYLFATAVQTGFLGLLLTYSARPWYSPYIPLAPSFGYTALEDQQVGGLIMWVPAGIVFTGIALLLVPAWLRSSDARLALWAGHSTSSQIGDQGQ